MSDNYEDEIRAAIARNNTKRLSPEEMAAITSKIDSTDHPALHKQSLAVDGITAVDSKIRSSKQTASRKAATKKENANLKTKVLGVRLSDAVYEEFSKIAAERHLTVAKLGSLLVEEFVTKNKDKK